jgi:selenocysteine lyase/cysteine desulfurase
MNITEARKLFPITNSGKIYFNHAATGPISLPVAETLKNYIKEKSDGEIDNHSELLNVTTESKNMLSALLNTTPDRIAFVDNTSNGINILAQGIEWKKGDRILLNDIEFPANVYPFLNLQSKGVIIDFVKSENGKVSAESIIKNVTPETKLISVSFVQFLSGYRVNVDKIGRFCREKGIIFCVDAIQGLGAVRLDVQKNKLDFLSCGFQKWMLGPQGLAFVYVSKNLQDKIKQSYVGWLAVKGAWDFLKYELVFKENAERYQGGTLNAIGIYAINTALKLFIQYGWDEIEQTILGNTSYFIDQLKHIGITPTLNECGKENLAGITSIKIENSQKIFENLTKKKIYIAVREGILRFSPHFYNTKEEIDIVISELEKLIK